MGQRLLGIGVLAGLLISLGGSMSVTPSQASGTGEMARYAPRPRGAGREGWMPSPAVLEFLRLPRTAPAEISATSAVLMDGESGEVFFARNPDEPLPPASITKILTALVILERGRLTDPVMVSGEAARVGGYRLGLQGGQQVSLGDLLAAILIRSANDAAVAAAEHVGGDLAGFVALMNARALELGMTRSRFANPHGLDEPFHFTTARDMALLTRVALQMPVFAELVRSREKTVMVWGPERRRRTPQLRVIQSHNKLLGRLEGADGVKTGYTEAAGQCLVASATRGDQRMIAVLLNDPERWSDAVTLLEFGFESALGAARGRGPGHPWGADQVGGGRG